MKKYMLHRMRERLFIGAGKITVKPVYMWVEIQGTHFVPIGDTEYLYNETEDRYSEC